jgi:hypothetical protein
MKDLRVPLAFSVISAFGCGERVVLPVCPVDAPVAIRTERGVAYHEHLQDALSCSRETGRPVLLLFDGYAQSNRACWDVLGNVDVQALIQDRLVLCVLMVDDRSELQPEDLIDFPQLDQDKPITTIGRRNSMLESQYFGKTNQPLFTLVNADFASLAEPMGYVPEKEPELLVNWIIGALDHGH